MKWSTILLGVASFAVTVSARCRPFNINISSPNEEINDLSLEDNVGMATLNTTGIPITGCFSDTSHGVLYGDSGVFILVPHSSGMETLIFASEQVAAVIQNSRWTDWNINEENHLTYGDGADKFVAFPTSNGFDDSWVVNWVPDGVITTANGFSFDAVVAFINT